MRGEMVLFGLGGSNKGRFVQLRVVQVHQWFKPADESDVCDVHLEGAVLTPDLWELIRTSAKENGFGEWVTL